MATHMYDQSVELRASTYVRIISLCASVRVPLIDTLDRSALIQEFEGREHVIYNLSRRLVDAETRYSAIEKLCLYLYFLVSN